MNNSSDQALDRKLRQPKSILINAIEKSSLTLQCLVDSNVPAGEIRWVYYQLQPNSNKPVNMSRVASVSDINHISSIQLDNIQTDDSGYYSCSMAIKLTDSLGDVTALNKKKSYYLNVQSTFNSLLKQKIFYLKMI